jgi:O-methyltransferase domain/Dimerisation domain
MSQTAKAATQRAAHPTLMPCITAFMASRIVQVAAELGIADLLETGSETSDALARRTQTHGPSLHRLLRALASLGVLDELESGRFALTALGTQLRSSSPDSLRHFAMMYGGERVWRCWSDLLHCVRTGQSGMQHLYGMGSFEYLASHPDAAAIFNAAMADVTRQITRAVVTTYDFSEFKSIVDVGGGDGTLIAAILTAASQLRGIVFDLPSGSAAAPRQLAAAGVADRCEVIAGDFFRAVPTAADAYILKSVIHDWDDERSVAILTACRKAMVTHGKLLLVERVMPPRMEVGPDQQRMAMLDMNMLVMPGGRERTEAEYHGLFAAAGFDLARVLPLPNSGGVSLIEGLPK